MPANLRVTGPTPLPDEVRRAVGQQVVSHRSDDFRRLLSRVVARLRPLFGTDGSVLPFTASGTGGLEALVQNAVPAGGRVLAVSCGHFGDRFAEVARVWGADVRELSLPWGAAAEPAAVADALERERPVDAVLATHNETSTGVLNPLREIASVVRDRSDALLLVDAVSSVGATEIEMDAWGIEAVLTVTQKALLSPPGLAIVAVGPRAAAAAARNARPRLYFDFGRMDAAVTTGTTTYTPAIASVYGLDAALEMIHGVGLAATFERHRRLAARARRRLAAAGFRLLADPAHASPTVTAVAVPAGVDAADVRQSLAVRHGVALSQGRGPWKRSALRIGHMGWVDQQALDQALDALLEVTREQLAPANEAAPVEANL